MALSFVGRGTLTFLDGSHYSGEYILHSFNLSRFSGNGTFTRADKVVYEGHFNNGRISRGKVIYPNGSVYEGEFDKKGFPEGQGTYTSSKKYTYVGEWKSGKYNGFGTLTYANGNYYSGNWKMGVKHGFGTEYIVSEYTRSGECDDGHMYTIRTMRKDTLKRSQESIEESDRSAKRPRIDIQEGQ